MGEVEDSVQFTTMTSRGLEKRLISVSIEIPDKQKPWNEIVPYFSDTDMAISSGSLFNEKQKLWRSQRSWSLFKYH